MYLMINMIHIDVLKFIEHIIFINSAIFERILNFIFIVNNEMIKNCVIWTFKFNNNLELKQQKCLLKLSKLQQKMINRNICANKRTPRNVSV